MVRRFDCHPKSPVTWVIGAGEIHLYESLEHHRNFLDGIRMRHPCAAKVEIGHRATSARNLVEVSVRLGRQVKWDQVKECFPGDDDANRMLAKANRRPWQL